MILKLAGHGAFDRPVAGIVDAGRHFVDQKLALMLKKFKGKHADVFQGFENAAGGVFGGALDGFLKTRRGGDGEPENRSEERRVGKESGAGEGGAEVKRTRTVMQEQMNAE